MEFMSYDGYQEFVCDCLHPKVKAVFGVVCLYNALTL